MGQACLGGVVSCGDGLDYFFAVLASHCDNFDIYDEYGEVQAEGLWVKVEVPIGNWIVRGFILRPNHCREWRTWDTILRVAKEVVVRRVREYITSFWLG